MIGWIRGDTARLLFCPSSSAAGQWGEKMEIGSAFEVDQLADDDKGHRCSFKGGYRAATVARQLFRLARVGPSSGKSSQAGISKPYKVLSLPLLYNSGLIQHLHFFRQNMATVRAHVSLNCTMEVHVHTCLYLFPHYTKDIAGHGKRDDCTKNPKDSQTIKECSSNAP